MANRYTRLSTASYNPMSLQELMMVPMAKRKQHDSSIAQAMEMGLFNNQASSADRATINKVKGEYEGSIDEYVEQLNKEGVSSSTTQGLLNLAKGRKELEKNYLNPAQANYQAMQEYKKQIMDSKDWSPQIAQAYAAQQLGQFKGTFNDDGTTNSFSASLLPNYIDPNKRLDDAIANIGEDSVQGELEKYDVHDVYDLMRSEKIQGKTKNKIIAALGAELQGDTNFLNSYRVESGMQGLNEFDANGNLKIGKFEDNGQFTPSSRLGLMLYGKAAGASSQKQSYTLKELKNQGRVEEAKRQLELENSGEIAYTSLPNERIQVYNQSLIKNLQGIGNRASKQELSGVNSNNIIAGLGVVNPNNSRSVGTMDFENSLDPQQQEQYNTLFHKLQSNGVISKDLDVASREGAKAVAEHMSAFEDADYSNHLIMPNAAGVSENEASLMLHTDNKKAMEFIHNGLLAGTTRMWNENGEAIEVDPAELEDKGYRYLGYVSPNNYIDKFRSANPAETAMPHMIVDNEGNRFYVSRPTSDYDKDRVKAGVLIKNITMSGATQPGLPVEQAVPIELAKDGVEDLITTFNPNTKTYNISFNFNGNPINANGISVKQFNEMVYELYN